VNGQWQAEKEIPSYLSTIGASEEIEEEIRRTLWSAISHPSTAVERSLHRLVECGQQISIEEIRLTLLPFLQRIASICGGDQAAEILGLYSRLKIPSLLPWSIEVKYEGDLRTAADKRLTLAVGSLGLPEVNYYKQHTTLKAYTQMIQKTTAELGLASPMSIAVPLESKLSVLRHAANEEVDTELPVAYTSQALKRAYAKIPWVSYWKGVGTEPTHVEADSPQWLAAVESCFAHWSPVEWQAVLTLHLLLWILPHLSAPFDTYFYEGIERPLTGQRAPAPRWIALYNSLRSGASRQLSRLFLDTYSPALTRLKGVAEAFSKTILAAAKRHVADLEWMSLAYKKNVLKRLETMTISWLASTGYLRDIDPVPNGNTSFLRQLLESAELESRQELERLSRSDPADYWSEPPYTVNAFYYHSTNQILLPAANFFWPFFDAPERIGWNYGGLGSILAHEITHSFDDTERAEWTAKNAREVSSRSKSLVRLFNRQKVFGRRVHGQLTITETMADLAGLKVALDACKQAIYRLPLEQQQAHLRDFFISYAVSWRTKEHPSKQLQRLLIDLHAPPRLRVNLIVNHFQEWYDLFGVEPRHALYLPPSKRVPIL
jgi:predicted metalloendopeptidase